MNGTNKPPADSGAIVTGETRGIGRQIVKRLHADGYGILFTHSNSLGLARELATAGICVDAVAPGTIDTTIHARAGVTGEL